MSTRHHSCAYRPSACALALLLAGMLLLPSAAPAHDEKESEGGAPGIEYQLGPARCKNGRAGDFSCRRVHLLSALPVSAMDAERANDIWGWTDPATGIEYALVGLSNGVSIVDLSDPEEPLVIGRLPTATSNSSWRDLKVHDDHMFVVSEADDHGLQVFDLTRVRAVADPPVLFDADARYTEFGSAHNLAINEESGFAYAVGAAGGEGCSGGLHMVDISQPTAPRFAGCFSADGYTHDVQCVFYDGPDGDHRGKEVCFAANEDTLTIVDVTDKQSPAQISRTGYSGSGYTHQGWLTPDHRYFLGDDELDEDTFGHGTRTYVWDVQDLDAPRVTGTYTAGTAAIDHNQYTRGRLTYQANYRAGLRILELADPAAGELRERGFFDVYPADDGIGFNGSWGVYPYFASGVVVVSSIESGLFVVRPELSNPRTRVGGLVTDRVTCRDQTERRTARLDLDGERRWSCLETGLELLPGNKLRQDLVAEASRAKVNGSVAGLAPTRVQCRNLTTRKKVQQRGDARRFDCAALGLEISPGDRLKISIWGQVD